MITIKKNYVKQISFSPRTGLHKKVNYLIRLLNKLNKCNCKIHNSIVNLKIKFKKFIIKYGYVSLIGLFIIILLSDIIINHYYKVNYLWVIYKFVFLSKSSAEWFGSIGTVATFLLALHKLFGRTKPGLRFHVDKDHVCVEVINNSSISGFALMTHVYISDNNGYTSPRDFIYLFQNDTYSEPFGANNKALIYLKRGKNDDRLRTVMNESEGLTKSKGLNDYHYLVVSFEINDHILPVQSRPPLDINKLNNLEWKHNASYYRKESETQDKNFKRSLSKFRLK